MPPHCCISGALQSGGLHGRTAKEVSGWFLQPLWPQPPGTQPARQLSADEVGVILWPGSGPEPEGADGGSVWQMLGGRSRCLSGRLKLLFPPRNAAPAPAGAGHICGLCPWRRESGRLATPQRQPDPGPPVGAGEAEPSAGGKVLGPHSLVCHGPGRLDQHWCSMPAMSHWPP